MIFNCRFAFANLLVPIVAKTHDLVLAIKKQKSAIPNPLLLSVSKRNRYQRQRIRISLLLSLKLEQVIVGAASSVRILSTNGRTSVVDSALARLWVEKLAGFAKYRIGLATQYPFLFKKLRVSHRCDLFSYAKVSGQSSNITRRHLNTLVY